MAAMQRSTRLVAFLVAAAFFSALWCMSERRSEREAATASGPPDRLPPPITHRAPPEARGAPVVPVTPFDAMPAAIAAEMPQGLSEAHAHLAEALAPCFATSAASDRAVVKFRYVLVVAGGTAHAADALVTEATEPVADVAECLAEVIGTATWPSLLPDLETPVEDQILVGELR